MPLTTLVWQLVPPAKTKRGNGSRHSIRETVSIYGSWTNSPDIFTGQCGREEPSQRQFWGEVSCSIHVVPERWFGRSPNFPTTPALLAALLLLLRTHTRVTQLTT